MTVIGLLFFFFSHIRGNYIVSFLSNRGEYLMVIPVFLLHWYLGISPEMALAAGDEVIGETPALPVGVPSIFDSGLLTYFAVFCYMFGWFLLAITLWAIIDLIVRIEVAAPGVLSVVLGFFGINYFFFWFFPEHLGDIALSFGVLLSPRRRLAGGKKHTVGSFYSLIGSVSCYCTCSIGKKNCRSYVCIANLKQNIKGAPFNVEKNK
jgi:hypothetical protein